MASSSSTPPTNEGKRVRRSSFGKLFSDEPREPSEPFTPMEKLYMPPSEPTARQLREARDQFSKMIPIIRDDEFCCAVDRAAVLDIYLQALEKITPMNHKQIQSEANMKIKIVLGITKAKPHDAAFASAGMLLKPLEPQYAEPRIEYLDDEHGHRTAWRLSAWRQEGWPDKYPANAIEREKKGEFPADGEEWDPETLKKMWGWDSDDWGDEVDAEPGSWVEDGLLFDDDDEME